MLGLLECFPDLVQGLILLWLSHGGAILMSGIPDFSGRLLGGSSAGRIVYKVAVDPFLGPAPEVLVQ